MRFLLQRPFVLFGIAASAFAAWIVWEARTPDQPVAQFDPRTLNKVFPPRPAVDKAELVADLPKLTSQVLPKLRPGMTRSEVEGLVGAPAPSDIHPAQVAGGRVTYVTAYDADLGAAPTIRSTRAIAPLGRQPADNKDVGRPPRTLVKLEFDATKPGHPLIEVHYPDPLF